MPALFIGGVLVSLYSILLFAARRPFRLSDGIAALLLLMLAVPVIVKMIVIGAVPVPMQRWMLLFLTCPFTYGPLLYLYVRAEITENPRFEAKWLAHFIPFVVFALLSLVFAFSELDMRQDTVRVKKSERIEERIPLPPHPGLPMPEIGNRAMPPHAPGRMPPFPGGHPGPPRPLPQLHNVPFLGIFLLISFISYTAVIVAMLVRHKKRMPDYFSFTSVSATLKWLQWIMVFFFISYSFVFLSMRIAPSLLRHPMLDPRLTPDIALTFFIIVFGFFSLRQPVLYRVPEPQQGGGEDQGEKKYEKSGLKVEDADRHLRTLTELMETEKPYLDPDLTIIDLSVRLGIPRHHLTQVINERLDRNFYLFVNEYRIGEARRIMADPKFSDHTILRIAYESGFNSKSVFNSIFKKITSHTPTEYRLSLE